MRVPSNGAIGSSIGALPVAMRMRAALRVCGRLCGGPPRCQDHLDAVGGGDARRRRATQVILCFLKSPATPRVSVFTTVSLRASMLGEVELDAAGD